MLIPRSQEPAGQARGTDQRSVGRKSRRAEDNLMYNRAFRAGF
jgi:hypothetical protein